MLTQEEVNRIVCYCKENDKTYKEYLKEHGIPAWKFYAAKKKYLQQPEEEGTFLKLIPSNSGEISEFFGNSNSALRNKTARKSSKKEEQRTLVNLEMKTVTGNLIRIQGEFTSKTLQELILASSGYVQS